MSWTGLISRKDSDARSVACPQLAAVANGDRELGALHLRVGFPAELPGSFQEQKNPALPWMIR